MMTPHASGYFRWNAVQSPDSRFRRSGGIGCAARISRPSASMRLTSSNEIKTMGIGYPKGEMPGFLRVNRLKLRTVDVSILDLCVHECPMHFAIGHGPPM